MSSDKREVNKRRFDDDEDYEAREDEEDADDVDSEFDEEDDEDVVTQKTSAHRFLGGQGFFLDEAVVEEDEEEEEDDEDEDDFVERAEDASVPFAASGGDGLQQRRMLDEIFREDMNVEKLEAYYKDKYSKERRAGHSSRGSGSAAGVSKREVTIHSGPCASDADVFAVKCRIGDERQTALLVLRRFLSGEYKNGFDVRSVVVKEGVRGYVYVEAEHRASVLEALSSLPSTRSKIGEMLVLPRSQMIEVVKPGRGNDITAGAWVRLKRGGIYRGDLALVMSVANRGSGTTTATLKLVPRVDYSRKRGALNVEQPTPVTQRVRRLPRRPLDVNALRALGGDPVIEGEFISFERQTFTRSGLLLKKFPITSIVNERVQPSAEDLVIFGDELDTCVGQPLPQIMGGDCIRVASGELRGSVGHVLTVEGDLLNVMFAAPPMVGARRTLSRQMVVKHFEVGNHVKVLAGKHENETGMIVAIDADADDATILSDMSMYELNVPCQDLRRCREMASGVDKFGRFEIGQMVLMSGREIGVLVRIEQDDMHVLDSNDSVVVCNRGNISSRPPRSRARCHDAKKCMIIAGDNVRVVAGPYEGAEGTVKYVYRQYTFVELTKAAAVSTNRRIIAAPGHYLRNKAENPAPSSSQSNGSAGRKTSGYSRPTGRDHRFIGRKVRVIRGLYKGKTGLVKDADESQAKVEIPSVFKVLFMEREDIVEIDKPDAAADPYRQYTSTYVHDESDMIYPRTPANVSQTPNAGGAATPAALFADVDPSERREWNPRADGTPHKFSSNNQHGDSVHASYPWDTKRRRDNIASPIKPRFLNKQQTDYIEEQREPPIPVTDNAGNLQGTYFDAPPSDQGRQSEKQNAEVDIDAVVNTDASDMAK